MHPKKPGGRRNNNMKMKLTMLAVAAMVTASVSTSQAQPYYLAGGYNGWNANNPDYIMSGGPTAYNYTVTNGTPASFWEFKVTTLNFGTAYPPGNCKTRYNSGGTNIIRFYPGTIVDGWSPIANRVGYDDPGNISWELAGDFNGWNGGDSLINLGSGLYSNSVSIATAGTHAFKFRSTGTWSELIIGTTFENGGADISFTTTNSPQVVPFRLDLPNGRFVVGSLAPPPVTNQVVFAVDMSSQIQLGLFNTNTDSVYVSGGFNGWAGTGPGALNLTNVPIYASSQNPNIYYGTNVFVGAPNSLGSEYKFTDNNPGVGNGGYEPRGSNRSFNLLSTNGVLMLPVVNFGDVATSDYLNTSVNLTFRVNMNGATNTFGVAWAGQNVYINGNFLTGGWIGTWNPIGLAGNLMTEETPGSGIYTFTYTVPSGNPVNVKYKYGFDDGVNTLDDEAASFQDHGRTIRTTATGSYTNALDKFGNQYVEPSFGQLSVGAPAAGKVPLSWLGRPGVYLQSSSNLSGGAWSTQTNVDGIYWSTGTYSTNGLTSVTNMPAGSAAQFYRLIKP
jgi:hypothetical protein